MHKPLDSGFLIRYHINMKPNIETKKWLASIGKKGGKKTAEIHGKKHYSKAGKKGYKKMMQVLKNRKNASVDNQAA